MPKIEKSLLFFLAVFLFLLPAGVFFLSQAGFFSARESVSFDSKTTIIEKNSEEYFAEIKKKEDAEGAGQNIKIGLEAVAENTEEIIGKAQDLVQEVQQYIQDNAAAREEALKKADGAKGVYMTTYTANAVSSEVRDNIEKLLAETELNAVVIDIKESDGPYLPDSLKNFIEELHKKNIWVIGRICAFRDSSLIKERPDLYLKTGSNNSTSGAAASAELWMDSGKSFWLDPASQEVQDYIINFSKKAVGLGFDELQFDYVRFPSDGDTKGIVYPFYNGRENKYDIIGDFFRNVSRSLRSYKPSIILSVDLFGYVASQYQASEIGQRIKDAADVFDYISFMLYPSHFYAGFSAKEDLNRQLPEIYFPYEATDTSRVVSSNPYQVILRSVFLAQDFLSGIQSRTKIRPWLQDFNLKQDTDRGIYYDAGRVRAQIQAAEDSDTSGWLLWNSSNVYTKGALK